jgi:hypothetical protein
VLPDLEGEEYDPCDEGCDEDGVRTVPWLLFMLGLSDDLLLLYEGRAGILGLL